MASSTFLIFNRIAKRYDLLNRLLSFGQDTIWRQKLSQAIPQLASIRYLDLGTGTGDVLFSMVQKWGAHRFSSVVGMDMAKDMLEEAKKKQTKWGINATFIQADAANLPLEDQSVDLVSMAFAIRNVNNMTAVLVEIYRVLAPGGKLLILEFGLPHNVWVRGIYLLYFRHILPFLGGWISGDRAAYRYLNQSVESFPYGNAFLLHLKQAGFDAIQTTSLTGGIVFLYEGTARHA